MFNDATRKVASVASASGAKDSFKIADKPAVEKRVNEAIAELTERLTTTETNMAYRTADHLRWQQMNFVTGIEIKLSNNHNCRGIAKGQFYDICDELAGVYPKDFKFVGWHPFCRCFAVPKLADMKEFLEYQDKFVAGEDVSSYKFSGEVTQMPKQFNEWVARNEERIKRAKSLPYFIRDNRDRLGIKLNNEIYTLSEKASVEKALKNERKRLLRQRSEVMSIIGKNGQILGSVEGTFGNVYFNDEIAEKIKDNIITHNHPGSMNQKGLLGIGRSLSDKDIVTAVECQAQSIVAETQLYRYSATRKGGSWNASADAIKKRYAEIYDELRNVYDKQISIGDRDVILQHLTMKKLSKEFDFIYSYKRI